MIIDSIEIPVVKFLNQFATHSSNPFLLTAYYSLYFAVLILSLFLLSKKKKINFTRYIVILVLGIILLGFLKDVVRRQRPFTVDLSIIPTIVKYDYSFPSRHTFVSFLTYFFIASHFKKFKNLFLIYFLVLLPLVYVIMGLHYPSDVVVGAFAAVILNHFVSEGFLRKYFRKLG